MFRQSTDVRTALAAAYKTLIDGGSISLFAGGVAPGSPQLAETGTYVGEITGVTFNAAAAGLISKQTGLTLSGVCTLDAGVSLTVTHCRMYGPTKITGASVPGVRLDFNVASSGAPAIMANPVVTGGATMTIDSITITVPE